MSDSAAAATDTAHQQQPAEMDTTQLKQALEEIPNKDQQETAIEPNAGTEEPKSQEEEEIPNKATSQEESAPAAAASTAITSTPTADPAKLAEEAPAAGELLLKARKDSLDSHINKKDGSGGGRDGKYALAVSKQRKNASDGNVSVGGGGALGRRQQAAAAFRQIPAVEPSQQTQQQSRKNHNLDKQESTSSVTLVQSVPHKKEVNETSPQHYEQDSEDADDDQEDGDDAEDEQSGSSYEDAQTDDQEESDHQESTTPESSIEEPPQPQQVTQKSPSNNNNNQFASFIDGIRNSLTSTTLDSATIANSAHEADLIKSAIQSSDVSQSQVLHQLYQSLRLLENSVGSSSSNSETSGVVSSIVPESVDKTEIINLIDKLKCCLLGRSDGGEGNVVDSNVSVIPKTSSFEMGPPLEKQEAFEDTAAQQEQEAENYRVPWQVRSNRRRTKGRSHSTGVSLEDIMDAKKFLEEDETGKNTSSVPQESQHRPMYQPPAHPQVYRDRSVPDMTSLHRPLMFTQNLHNQSQKIASFAPFNNQDLVMAPKKFKPFRTYSLENNVQDRQNTSFQPLQGPESNRTSEEELRPKVAPVQKYRNNLNETQQVATVVPVNSVAPARVTYQLRPGSSGQEASKTEQNDRQVALPYVNNSPISINSNMVGSNRVDNVQISLTEFNSAEFPAQLQIAITLKTNPSGGGADDNGSSSSHIQTIDLKLNNDQPDLASHPESDAKADRYRNKKEKKKKMKRANTIDIPKPPGLILPAELEDDQDQDSHMIQHHPSGIHVPFQPKSEGDKKFLAFLEKNNAFEMNRPLRPAYLMANDRQWTNRFSNLKTSFESGGSSPSVSPQPLQLRGKSVADIAMATNMSPHTTTEFSNKPIWAANRKSPMPSNVRHKLQVFESQQSDYTTSPIPALQQQQPHRDTMMLSAHQQFMQPSISSNQPTKMPFHNVVAPQVKSNISRFSQPFTQQEMYRPQPPPKPTAPQQNPMLRFPPPDQSVVPAAAPVKHQGVHMVHATASASEALQGFPKKQYVPPPHQPYSYPMAQQNQLPHQIQPPLIKPLSRRPFEPEQQQQAVQPTQRVSSARSAFESQQQQQQQQYQQPGIISGKLSLQFNDTNNMMQKRPTDRKMFEKDMSFHTNQPQPQPVPPHRGPTGYSAYHHQTQPLQPSNNQSVIHHPLPVQPVSLRQIGISKSFDEAYSGGSNSQLTSPTFMGPVPNIKLNASSKSSFASVVPRKATVPPMGHGDPYMGDLSSSEHGSPGFSSAQSPYNFIPLQPSPLTAKPPSPTTRTQFGSLENLITTPVRTSQQPDRPQFHAPPQLPQPRQPPNAKAVPPTSSEAATEPVPTPGSVPNSPSATDFGDGMIQTPVTAKVRGGAQQATITSRAVTSLHDEGMHKRTTAISNLSSILNQYQSQSTDKQPPSPLQREPPSSPRQQHPPSSPKQEPLLKMTEKPTPTAPSSDVSKQQPSAQPSPPQPKPRSQPAPVKPEPVPRQKSMSDLVRGAETSALVLQPVPAERKKLVKQHKALDEDQAAAKKAASTSELDLQKPKVLPHPFIRSKAGRSCTTDQIPRTASGTSIFERTKSLFISVQDLPPQTAPGSGTNKSKVPAAPKSQYYFPKQYEAQMSPDSADKKQRELQAYFNKSSSSKTNSSPQHLRKSSSHSKIMQSQKTHAIRLDEDVDHVFESLLKATGDKINISQDESPKASSGSPPQGSLVASKPGPLPSASAKVDPKSSPTTAASGAPLFQFTNPALKSGAASAKEMLLYWCQCRTRDYQNIKVENFSSSWSNGLAFCALIHHYYPDAFDYEALDPKQRKRNFELAFKVAEEKADIYPLLDVEDMLIMGNRPDWKCVFTYVQSMYRKLKERD